MRHSIAFITTIAFAASLGAAADAAPCKDAKGRFIKCPAPVVSTSRCRDKTTAKFVKCGAPNSEAMPMKALVAPKK